MLSRKNAYAIAYAVFVIAQTFILGMQMAYGQEAAPIKDDITDPNVRHEKAKELFQQQQPDAALSILADLYRSNPDEFRYLYDYLAIASWSGRHELAISLSKSLNMDDAPAYVLEALAQSHRQQKAFDSALATCDIAIKQFPDRVEPRVGRVNVLIDAERLRDAENELSLLRVNYSNRQEVWIAAVRLSDAQKQPIKTLQDAEQILKASPDNPFALRMRFYALKKLGAAHLAGQLTPKPVLSPSEQSAANRDQLAFELRWARINADNMDQPYRWQEMDAVISKMQDICELNGNKGGEPDVIQGGCWDLVVALSDRQRMTEAIALYEKMLDKRWSIPTYVHLSAAASYLYKQQPEKARDIFSATLPQDPNNLNGRVGNIYALLECAQYDEAYRQADQLSNVTGEWVNAQFPEIRQPNPAYIRAQLTSALIRSYTDRLAEGQGKLELLAKRAPHNAEIRQSLAMTYGMRGWHHQAENDFEWLHADDPLNVATKMGLFETRMALGDFRGAEEQLKAVAQLMPDEQSVQKPQREWEMHNMHQLLVDAKYGQSAGGAVGLTPNGSRESMVDTRLYSVPYNYDWRYFAHTQLASIVFPEITAARTAIGGGAEYRARDFTVTGEILNIGHSGTGMSIEGEYRIGDFWAINGKLENNSLSAPIRAYSDHVTANNYQLGAMYRWDESRSFSVAANQMRFSDGNQRQAMDASWNERLITGPIYKLDSVLEYYASRNSSQNPLINYFNPISDNYLGLSFQNEWVQFHRYEKSLKHILRIGIGNYAQQNFSAGNTINAHYEQIYRPDDRLELRYGIGHTAHPYDGTRVTGNFINLAINWMF